MRFVVCICALVTIASGARFAIAQPTDAETARPAHTALPAAPPSAPPGAEPRRDSPRAVPAPAKTAAPALLPASDSAFAHDKLTPRRSLAGFLRLSAAGDFAHAQDFLDLRNVPRERRTREGPELAAMLYRVLTWRIVLDPEQLSDEPVADTQPIVLDAVEVDGAPVEIRLGRVKVGSDDVWLFSKETVASIRAIYAANERRWLEDNVPPILKRGDLWGVAPWQWIGLVTVFALAYAVGRIFGAFGVALCLRFAKGGKPWISQLIRKSSRPARLALGVAVFAGLVDYLLLPKQKALYAGYAETTLGILVIAWLLTVLLRVGTSTYEASLPDDTQGHVENRGLRTRLAMVRRVGTVLIGIVAAGVMLLQFDVVRSVGLSLLASAGIAGVLVGFAAQRTLGGIVSGIEMSVTQPVRIGDLVVIDGEQGIVERMFFTYIVVRLWDDRRLIVPVQRVMASSLENWTRMGSDVLAPVEIFVDYDAPIDLLRAEFRRLCKATPLWDGRKADVYVIDATDKGLKIRGLASVDNAARAFELRCQLREGWVGYLQKLDGGIYLPRGRVTSVAVPGAVPAPAASSAEAIAATAPAGDATEPAAESVRDPGHHPS